MRRAIGILKTTSPLRRRAAHGLSTASKTLTAEGTDLAEDLRKQGIRHVFIGGLATDYCVKNTVLDALDLGFDVILLEDAIRGVEVTAGDSDKAVRDMVEQGAKTATFNQIV